MRIVLINHYAGSPRHGMEFRPYYLARAWVARGHEVTVVAATQSHVRRQAPCVTHGGTTEEFIDGIRYLWVATPPYQGNGFRRALNIGSFVAGLMLHRRDVVGPSAVDAVIASSTYPLDILAARLIARQSGAALIFEVHDLWPLSPIELGGMSRRHPFIQVMQWAEDSAYKRADRVVSILPHTLAHMVEHGMAPEKFAYIPNGVDVSEWTGTPLPIPEEHSTIIRRAHSLGKLLIGYAGAHGIANALNTILDAAALLRDEDVSFVLVGQGPEKRALEERAAALGLERVHFLPAVEKAAVPSLLAEFDVACLTLQSEPLFRYGISPNKLFDYMMAGRPVLQAVDAGNDVVAASGCGISVRGEDPEALADGIRRFLQMGAAERRAMGARGREYVERHHTYDVLADSFLGVIGAARDKVVREDD